jgi:hypothetical protein
VESPPPSRVYEGADVGTRVTGWLNGHGGEHNSKASRKRIEDLLECLRETIAIVESVPPDFNWPNAGFAGFPPEPKGFDELTTELHYRLAEYITYPAFGTGVWGKEWEISDAVCGRRPPGESVAAHSLIELAKRGLLDRIHQCDCGKWYFARFAHQRSCSATCRRRVYEKTEKFKAQRRKYMRKYYKLKNSGKVK